MTEPDSGSGRDRDDRPWRPASSGASHVYVIPCLGEDLLKLGMSRDPLDRFQTLQPRWFDFFDLDAALLIRTDSVREARAIELRLGRELQEHGAPAPLLVSAAAGGHTEWYRGALAHLERAAEQYRALGYTVLRPLRPWLREALAERGALLFHWCAQMLEAIEASPDSAPRLGRTLRDALDAYDALDLPIDGLVPAAVLRWRDASKARSTG